MSICVCMYVCVSVCAQKRKTEMGRDEHVFLFVCVSVCMREGTFVRKGNVVSVCVHLRVCECM